MIRDIIFSLSIVLKKYILEYLFCSVYEILFYEGVFDLIVFIIALFIYTNINSSRCNINYNNLCYIDTYSNDF